MPGIPGNSGFPIKESWNAKQNANLGNSGIFIMGIPNGHFYVGHGDQLSRKESCCGSTESAPNIPSL